VDWIQEITKRVEQDKLFQISIDAQIWTVDAREDGVVEFYNDLGRRETFADAAGLLDALQSWYENPTIIPI